LYRFPQPFDGLFSFGYRLAGVLMSAQNRIMQGFLPLFESA